MWQVWQMSKEWKKPPSEILNISDDLEGYYLNQAVIIWGRTVEQAVDEATSDCKSTEERKAKAQRELDYWLAEIGEEINPKRFKSPGI